MRQHQRSLARNTLVIKAPVRKFGERICRKEYDFSLSISQHSCFFPCPKISIVFGRDRTSIQRVQPTEDDSTHNMESRSVTEAWLNEKFREV